MLSTQDKIRELSTEIKQLVMVNEHFNSRFAELSSMNKDFEVLEIKLFRLYEEIESLESKSITSMFHSLIGNKEQRLDKAKAAYYETNIKYVAFKKNIETLEYEMDILSKKAAKLAERQQELSSLLAVREDELQEEDSIQGKRLRKLLGELEENDRHIQQVESILNSGRLTMKKVSMTILSLREASNWGQWEKTGKRRPPLRGQNRKRAINDAKQLANEAIRTLNNFEKDLAVVGIKFQAEELDLKSFNSVLDVILDNVISDFIFQQKAQKNLAALNRIMDDVKSAVEQLDKELIILKGAETQMLDSKEKFLLA
jgi:chromosome segregation ATPase